MQRILRISAGVVIVCLVAAAAYLATMDCRIVSFVYENCMWLGLQRYLGLPDNRFLRMMVMECVGIFLVLVLWLTYRYLFAFRRAPQDASQCPPVAPQSPRN